MFGFKNPSDKLHSALRGFEKALAQLDEVSNECEQKKDDIDVHILVLQDEKARLNATHCRASSVAEKLRELIS